MSWVKRVDHVAYAVAKGMVEKWAWYHIEVEGGSLCTRIDDVAPESEESSMKIWCIDYGSFGIALVEGIDRSKQSQVSAFVEKHGDHTVQHVAYDTGDLEAFLEHMKEHKVNPRGEIFVRSDGFGTLKQIFCKGYAEQDAAVMSFPEYVARPKKNEDFSDAKITFSKEAGKTFYNQIENARETGDRTTLLDFSAMPDGWEPPEPKPHESRK